MNKSVEYSFINPIDVFNTFSVIIYPGVLVISEEPVSVPGLLLLHTISSHPVKIKSEPFVQANPLASFSTIGSFQLLARQRRPQ